MPSKELPIDYLFAILAVFLANRVHTNYTYALQSGSDKFVLNCNCVYILCIVYLIITSE